MTEKTKNPVGRPSKYTAEMQAQADSYVFNWHETDKIPSRVGLCCFIGIDKSTSYEWEQSYPQFSDTLRKVDTLQEQVGLNKGITGEFNSTITKLVLANHGYSERQSLDHISTDGSMTPKVIERHIVDAKNSDS
jgi:hypothetical protein